MVLSGDFGIDGFEKDPFAPRGAGMRSNENNLARLIPPLAQELFA